MWGREQAEDPAARGPARKDRLWVVEHFLLPAEE
jgi:hypothetical protein